MDAMLTYFCITAFIYVLYQRSFWKIFKEKNINQNLSYFSSNIYIRFQILNNIIHNFFDTIIPPIQYQYLVLYVVQIPTPSNKCMLT